MTGRCACDRPGCAGCQDAIIEHRSPCGCDRTGCAVCEASTAEFAAAFESQRHAVVVRGPCGCAGCTACDLEDLQRARQRYAGALRAYIGKNGRQVGWIYGRARMSPSTHYGAPAALRPTPVDDDVPHVDDDDLPF